MKNVMARAWEIARAAVTKFGGKVKEYFAQALAQAWKEVKTKVEPGMRVHTWTTAKGSVIEIHAKHVTETTWKDDWGMTHFKPANHVFIKKVVANDKEYYGQGVYRTTKDGQNFISLGEQVVNGKRTRMFVPLPADINQAVWGEHDRIEASKAERRKAAAKAEREELQAKIRNGYCTKCHSYCYGDCQA
ncbi:hypothetical protein [Paenibacillus macerans]|uniref:hypothetical protein n=1 Tax=Paenibacillus macerans TaxID=44252 RepID=UPI0020410E89|nr:hypothetical protein [Paenibacillus macerans]MCM3699173.1 hypothetical protein [Paenibacillus macerans]